MELGLSKKRVWITGGSSGIGLAIAEAFAAESAQLIVSSRSTEKLESARATLLRKHPNTQVDLLPIDLLSETSVTHALNQVGDIDVLIYNSGGPRAGSVESLELAAWDAGYHSLLRHLILMFQKVTPSMRQKKWGRLLTITSTSAKERIDGLPISGVFRAGLTAFTKSASREVGPDNILINNLLPGPTATERLTELATHSPTYFESMTTRTALKRIAHPSEIARAAAFLCSNANTYITGTDILADGGFTAAY